jgi:DNA-binding NarL/FixJ family response regulator
MKIAIVGQKRKLRDEVESKIKEYVPEGRGVGVCQYETDKREAAIPPDICALFVIVDSASALRSLPSVVGWGGSRPVVIVSDHPQYAIEGVRLQVKHYLLFPLTPKDMREAIPRLGLGVMFDE